MTLLLHIATGSLAIVSGAIALYSAKGGTLHRKAGMIFVASMLTMSISGATMAMLRNAAPLLNVPAGLLTAYLVFTALTTVRPLSANGRWLDVCMAILALAVGLGCLLFAFEAMANGSKGGMPPYPYFMFAAIGCLGGLSDFRMIRKGGLQGAPRLARHLWRMCLALFIATASLFLGQADVFPEALRLPALRAAPVLAIIATMLYWLWRVRSGRGIGRRGITTAVGDTRRLTNDHLSHLPERLP